MENITSEDQMLEEAINNDANQNLKELFEKREAFIKSMNTRPNVKVSRQTFEAYQTAMQHYSKEEYKEAFECFTKAADGGHSPSMHKLGVMYCKAQGVKQDYTKAMEMFKKAIKNDGDVDSVFMIGLMYYQGLGVEQNDRKAFDIIMQAAFSGHAEAQSIIGNMYITGVTGIAPAPEKAIGWLKLAAEQNSTQAMSMLAEFYIEGNCITKDVEKGIKFLEKSAQSGRGGDYVRLANIYRKGEVVEKDEKKAFEYVSKGVDAQNEQAVLLYSQMLIKGQGCEKDVQRGLEILEMMAEKLGSKDAILSLANNYLFIDEVTPNPKRAVELLRPLMTDTSDLGTAFNALFFVALIPSKYDVEEAGLTYKEVYDCMMLCEQNTSSFNNTDLGLLYLAFYKMYTNGKYLKVDKNKAKEYLEKSVSFGNKDAIKEMAKYK